MGYEFDDDYVRDLNLAYWAEMEEMKTGTHPIQVRDRIQSWLEKNGVSYNDITFLDWNFSGPKVEVSLDNRKFGIFNYETNVFENIYELV